MTHGGDANFEISKFRLRHRILSYRSGTTLKISVGFNCRDIHNVFEIECVRQIFLYALCESQRFYVSGCVELNDEMVAYAAYQLHDNASCISENFSNV